MRFLGLETLQVRRKNLDLILTHHLYTNGETAPIIRKPMRENRSKNLIALDSHPTGPRTQFFTNRIGPLWNSLPNEVTDLSFSKFKRHVKRQLDQRERHSESGATAPDPSFRHYCTSATFVYFRPPVAHQGLDLAAKFQRQSISRPRITLTRAIWGDSERFWCEFSDKHAQKRCPSGVRASLLLLLLLLLSSARI